jgi:hypothetical protein
LSSFPVAQGYEKTPLCVATEANQTEVVTVLLTRKPDLNKLTFVRAQPAC